MAYAQAERMRTVMVPSPVRNEKPERRATLLQAVRFQGRELIEPCEDQNTCPHDPCIDLEPRVLLNVIMEEPITDMGNETKERPAPKIACNQKNH